MTMHDDDVEPGTHAAVCSLIGPGRGLDTFPATVLRVDRRDDGVVHSVTVIDEENGAERSFARHHKSGLMAAAGSALFIGSRTPNVFDLQDVHALLVKLAATLTLLPAQARIVSDTSSRVIVYGGNYRSGKTTAIIVKAIALGCAHAPHPVIALVLPAHLPIFIHAAERVARMMGIPAVVNRASWTLGIDGARIMVRTSARRSMGINAGSVVVDQCEMFEGNDVEETARRVRVGPVQQIVLAGDRAARPSWAPTATFIGAGENLFTPPPEPVGTLFGVPLYAAEAVPPGLDAITVTGSTQAEVEAFLVGLGSPPPALAMPRASIAALVDEIRMRETGENLWPGPRAE